MIKKFSKESDLNTATGKTETAGATKVSLIKYPLGVLVQFFNLNILINNIFK